MLASETFAGAERSRALLRFVVEHALRNQSDRLKEYTIGSEALERGDSFDPRTDPIVRAEASRLRDRLQRYYATSGAADTVVITLPKGSYVPQFHTRPIPEAAQLTATAIPAGPPSTRGRLQRVIWFVLGGVTVAAAVALLALSGREAPPADVGGDHDLGSPDYSLASEFGNDVILSPNGTRIVFVALGSDGEPRLMTMSLERGQRRARLLPGTEGARAPFFSPDGRWVGYWASPKLKMVSIDGGDPIELTDAVGFGGATWGQSGIIAAIDGTLKRVSQTSRESPVIADLRKEGIAAFWPDLLPGEAHVLFTALGSRGPDASNIAVLSLSDRKSTPLVRAGFGRYLRDGYLMYVNQGTLFAVPFDPRQPAVQGTGVKVLDDRVAQNSVFGNAKLDIAPNGTLVYRRSPALVASWLDRGGAITPLLTRPAAYTFPRLSPDGRKLAINVIDSGVIRSEIHDLHRPDAPPVPLPAGTMSAAWHSDRFLVLGSYNAGMSWMSAEDPSAVGQLTRSTNVQVPLSFTANGTHLAFLEESAATKTGLDIWTIPVSQSAGTLNAGAAEPYLQTPVVESAPSFSADGRWLLYGQGTKGIWDVWAGPFPRDPSKAAVKVSEEGGGRIGRWLSNGRQIVYRTDDHRLMVVDYQLKNGAISVGKAKEWTTVRLGDTGVIPNFDVVGERILGLVPASREEAERIRTQITVIPRIGDEIRRRLAQGGK